MTGRPYSYHNSSDWKNLWVCHCRSFWRVLQCYSYFVGKKDKETRWGQLWGGWTLEDDVPVEVWRCLGERAADFLTRLFNNSILESNLWEMEKTCTGINVQEQRWTAQQVPLEIFSYVKVSRAKQVKIMKNIHSVDWVWNKDWLMCRYSMVGSLIQHANCTCILYTFLLNLA